MLLLATESTAADIDVSTGSKSTSSSDADGDKTEESDETLPLDQVFEILKNQRRRYVLSYLKDHDESVSISDLSERIAAWENDKPVSQITSSERKRVYVGLYQCHLPKMDDVDVIEFNKPRGIVELSDNAEIFDRYLDSADAEAEPAWHRYYAAAAALSVFALASGAAITTAAPAVPAVEFAAVLAVGLFSLCSLVHLRWVRRHGKEE